MARNRNLDEFYARAGLKNPASGNAPTESGVQNPIAQETKSTNSLASFYERAGLSVPVQSVPATEHKKESWEELMFPKSVQEPEAPSYDLDALRKEQQKLQQQQAAYSRSFSVTQEQREATKARLEEISGQIREAERQKSIEEQKQDAKLMESDMAEINANNGKVLGYLKAIREAQMKMDSAPEFSLDNRSMIQNAQDESQAKQALKSMGYDDKRINELMESYIRSENAQIAQGMEQDVSQGVRDTNVFAQAGASAGARGLNLIGGVAGTAGALGATAKQALTGSRYRTIDPNLPGYAASRMAGAIDSGITQRIESGKSTEEKDNGIIGKIGSTAYKVLTSTADNLVRAYASGGSSVVASGLAATSSFQDAFRSASERGATPEQAMTMGLIDGGLEVITEKIGYDKLFKNAENVETVKDILRNAAAQAGSEIMEEETSFLGNLIADAYIMRDKSEFNESVRDMMDDGMTESEAKEQAWKQLLHEAAETAITSGLSGGLMAAGYDTPKYFANRNNNASNQSTAQGADRSTGQSNVQEQEQATVQKSTAEKAVEAAREAGEVTNSQVETIIADPEAVAELGVTLDGTKAENRNAVREALEEKAFSQETADKRTETEEDVNRWLDDLFNSAEWAEEDNPFLDDFAQEMEKPEAPKKSDAERDVEAAAESMFREVAGKNVQSDDVRQSRTYTNSGSNNANENVRSGYLDELSRNQNAADYIVKHDADVQATADKRTETEEGVNRWYDYLVNSAEWTAEDNRTASNILDKLWADGDIQKADALRQKRKEIGTAAGQLIHSFKDDVQTVRTATESAMDTIDGFSKDEVKQKFNSDSEFTDWKNNIKNSVYDLGKTLDGIKQGNTGELREFVRELARIRKTTAWFGYADRLTTIGEKLISKLDEDTLRFIARAQITAIPSDYKKVPAVKMVHAFAVNSMLFGGSTVSRNLEGNATVGIMDLLSASTFGRLIDYGVGKATGQREVGNDIRYTKEYIQGAKDATAMAALCVELNIPIESDLDSTDTVKYSDNTRTFNPNGNIAIRALSAWEKYMQYALGVTDKFFEGGTSSAVKASLQNLNSANAEFLANSAAEARTFKQDGALSKMASGFQKYANSITDNVSVAGYSLRDINIGDMVMPFAKVPANVAQVGIDYTIGGAIGVSDIVGILRDAKAGKSIEAGRQQKAVTRTARGVTGIFLVGLFTAAAKAGILKVSNDEDKDKRASDKAQGLSGAQFNISAFKRLMFGESTDIKEGDILRSEDSLEPFNTLMYLGYAIAESDNGGSPAKAAGNLAKAEFNSVISSFMDSPVVSGLSDAMDIIESVGTADGASDFADGAMQYAVGQATKFVPQAVRSLAYGMDNTERDTRGATGAETAINQFKAAVPWLRESLPAKYDITGNPVSLYDSNASALLGKLVDPQRFSVYKPNEISEYLDKLNSYIDGGSPEIYIDSVAPKSFQVGSGDNAVKFALDTPELREKYQRNYATAASEIYSAIISNEWFDSLTSKEKADVLSSANSDARALAKASVSDYELKSTLSGKSNAEIAEHLVRSAIESKAGYSGERFENALKAGFSISEMKQMHDYEYGITKAFTSITDAWKSGNNITDTKYANEAYRRFLGFTQAQKDYVINNAASRIANYINARRSGYSTSEFLKAYQLYYEASNADGLSTKEKDLQYKSGLQKLVESGEFNNADVKYFSDMMHFNMSSTARTNGFDEMVSLGMDSDTAQGVAQDIIDFKSENPGAKTGDIYNAIVDSMQGKSDEFVLDAFLSVTDDFNPDAKSVNTAELNVRYMYDSFGMSVADIAMAQMIWDDASLTKREKEARLNALHSGLYRLYNDGKKTVMSYYGY